MIFIIPVLFGALGVAVGAVVGAMTTHAASEKDRQAAKQHRAVANALREKYSFLEKRYTELAENSQQQITDLLHQKALLVIENDCLRLALRLRDSLDELRSRIEQDPTEVALKEYCQAVEITNIVLLKLNEEQIYIPSEFYARILIKAERQKALFIKVSPSNLSFEEQTKVEETIVSNSTPINSQAFQEAHDQIYGTGNRLLQYLHELRAGRLTEGDESKGLQPIEDRINRSLKALKEQKYQVAVIAAMKAGKSTFLNALIGSDVLASEAEACTVCRTDIRPISVSEIPKLFEYQEGHQKPILLVEGDDKEIRKKFLERTREIRSNKNHDNVTRFELHHPIEAIKDLSCLAEFRLVDTPGPNEWESIDFSTVSLKQAALEALRTCDVILFILDYTCFKDDINAELLRDLIEQRSEFLENSSGKLYFILNKVDCRSEKDRAIADVSQDLSNTLVGFGVSNPVIYPVSAWEGLLAKLIQNQTATQEHKLDFRNFFSVRYVQENDDGDFYIPKSIDIAPTALQKSGIIDVEESVIQTVVQNSGWNLLNDVLAELKKAAQAIFESLDTEIKGWQIELTKLEQKVEEYKHISDLSRKKVASVKKSIEGKKQVLITEFSQEIKVFSDSAKRSIEKEIEKLVKDVSSGRSYEKSKSGNKSFFDQIFRSISIIKEFSQSNPYRIKLNSKQDAERVGRRINDYCTPIIQNFWLNTQDKLVRKGSIIREELVQSIKQEIQSISDEISVHLGKSLEINFSTNPIQFPNFEFSGIDAKVQRQQEVVTRYRKETRTNNRCCKSSSAYDVDVPYEAKVDYYEIDLKQVLQEIKQKIDAQVAENLGLLQKVIEKQVLEDFHSGEKQINEYINRFQSEFDYLLKNKARREVEAPQIVQKLRDFQTRLNQDLITDLLRLQKQLDVWKSIS